MFPGKSVFYLYMAALFVFAALIIIPRKLYKKFFIYGFMYGGLGSLIQILVLEKLLGWIKYNHLGPFNVMETLNYWSPIAWAATFALFCYLLPVRRVFTYLYVIGFGIFAFMTGDVLEDIGLYQYVGFYKYLAPFLYSGWFGLAAWLYFRSERIKLQK